MKLFLSLFIAFGLQVHIACYAQDIDTDGDTIPDAIEDINGNGIVDVGETDPNNADTDDGGESDGQELILGQDPLDKSDDQTSDTDGDGLIGRIEHEMGTDPNNADTDGDGIQDGQDPFPLQKLYSRDTDSDGIPDAWEQANGFDPNNPADALQDQDADGLSNLQEFQIGSSPLLQDTDKDTLDDAFEAALGTDPNTPDTDGDGVSDAQELQNGTNPQQSDSDNDGTADDQDTFPLQSEYSIDSDSDGLPDSWERIHGLNPSSALDAAQDADNDGLTNLEEFQRKTNPNTQDTDKDGLKDGLEVSIGSNPLVEDTDNDGIKDGHEYAMGTNPALRDTDRDGIDDVSDAFPLDSKYTKDSDNDDLPDAWEQIHGFDPNNPADAQQDADSDGLSNAQEFRIGTWPTKQDSDGDGIVDGQDQFPLRADFAQDTDRDGLPDAWEEVHGLNPNDASDASLDDDGDSLSNLEEFTNDTNPQEADTDHDGLPDDQEIKNELNPNAVDSDNDGTPDAEDFAPNNSEYSKDSDNDGIPDAWETKHGLNPMNADDAQIDTDKDGLSNVNEFLKHTNPLETDTDRDGIPDGQEVKAGKDPSVNGCLAYTEVNTTFVDMDNHWALDAVTHLSRTTTLQTNTAIFSGYTFGDPDYNLKAFFPNKPITRFELLKVAMLSNCIVLKSDADIESLTFSFSDLPRSSQSEKNTYIYSALVYGIVQGYGDGTFLPDKPVNRAEALKILLESAQISAPHMKGSAQEFKDVPLNSWFATYTNIARYRKIVEGFDDNTFRPEQLMTRAEAAKILVQIILQNPYVNGSVIPIHSKKEVQ